MLTHCANSVPEIGEVCIFSVIWIPELYIYYHTQITYLYVYFVRRKIKKIHYLVCLQLCIHVNENRCIVHKYVCMITNTYTWLHIRCIHICSYCKQFENNSTNIATTYEALTNIETFSMLNRVLHLNFFMKKGMFLDEF